MDVLNDSWVYEAAPCEDCPHIARCRGGQACAAFQSFVVHGGRRWTAEPRVPSRAHYVSIFREQPVNERHA